ncbi:hypothetical protein AALO_G00219540 [Alosa alosa]|uniref:Beta-2-microglobulin n=1 Tax=Alosa alosa TaxID=278164 RepID=A0AAV6FWU3_9TELE|nr:hypothetical protein AALO_G00219540 [Alosa alosa]
MKYFLCFAILFYLGSCALGKQFPPKVQVYSRNPGKLGEKNTLICHVSDFHPPDITITLLRNGVEIPDANQTDLAFETTPGNLTCKMEEVGVKKNPVVEVNLISSK